MASLSTVGADGYGSKSSVAVGQGAGVEAGLIGPGVGAASAPRGQGRDGAGAAGRAGGGRRRGWAGRGRWASPRVGRARAVGVAAGGPGAGGGRRRGWAGRGRWRDRGGDRRWRRSGAAGLPLLSAAGGRRGAGGRAELGPGFLPAVVG